jgi:hypothetical protein
VGPVLAPGMEHFRQRSFVQGGRELNDQFCRVVLYRPVWRPLVDTTGQVVVTARQVVVTARQVVVTARLVVVTT